MKSETQSAYYEAINRVIEYINSHLYDTLTIKNLAGIAHLSEYHFHRIFKSIIGEPVGAYIVRLRLEHIAQKLQLTSHSLTTIAEQTAYESKHALSKKFKKHFGINPSEFRSDNQKKVQGFRYTHKLSPRIENVPNMTVVYIRIISKYGEEELYTTSWAKLFQFAKEQNLLNSATESLGMSFDDPSITNDRCRFYACISVNKKVKPQGEFGVKNIDGGLYAIFTLKGSYSQLNDFYSAIIYEWLPNSDYKYRKGAMFEKYLNNPNKVAGDEILTEAYIPVKIKEIRK